MTPSKFDFNRWRAELEAVARTGLAFSPNVYDCERFEEVLRVALEMSGGEALFPPVDEPIIDLRDDDDFSIAARYVTPKVGVSVAIANHDGQLLLHKRAASGLWGLVGGYADVGYSAAEVAVKEAKEEVGFDIEVLRLIGVFDGLQAKRQSTQYGLMFLARVTGGKLRLHPKESAGARWCEPDNLPSPLYGDGDRWLSVAFDAIAGRLTAPYFERPRPAQDVAAEQGGLRSTA